ncbi:MAG: hypothetical protein KF749_01060 [Bacteroidetes bacterium]|nr:hypothetical protein [Bacteroidota bacterium]MCW5897259.1 hypothetical protein [Bacteroidota bacterium]
MRNVNCMVAIFASAIIVLASCTTNDPAPADLTYIPPINGAFWTNTADPNHTFDFNADSSNINVSTGIFTGTETLNSTVSNLTGSFSNRNISITIQRPSGTARFDGQFLSDSLIDFGSFRIRR